MEAPVSLVAGMEMAWGWGLGWAMAPAQALELEWMADWAMPLNSLQQVMSVE